MTTLLTLPTQLEKYILPVFDRKAKSVMALNVEDLTSYTDVLVIVEAGSKRQVSSIAQHVVKTLKGQKVSVLGAEGIKEGEWALLDYGEIIIHVFETQAKSFYDLEGLWADAQVFDLSKFDSSSEQSSSTD